MKHAYVYWVVAASGALLPGRALAQVNSQRPSADTAKTQCLGSVEVRGEVLSTSKMTVSAEATASPAAVPLVGRA